LGEAAAIRATSGKVLRSFGEIEAEAVELEGLFARFPVGSAIGLQIGNNERWPALLIALFRSGLVPVPLGRHVEAAELQDALDLCGVAALFTIENGAVRLERRTGGMIRHSCQFLKLTSGTTCAPRAIRFQAAQLLADCSNICETMGITDRDLNFGVIPFSHSYGFSNLITPLICRGVPLVASDERMPRAILHDLASSGATVFPGMPVFFDKLSALECDAKLPALRLCISAGAPLPKQVAEAFHRRFGKKIHTFYGSSECGGIGYDASPGVAFEECFAGTAMTRVEIAPEPGEGDQRIIVRSAAVADGYFPENDCETLGGGRFIPGDLVRWTGCGMFIAGRASDMINIAGRKLNPGEIEGRISAFPGVFGVPSALRGEEPVACVAGQGIDRTSFQRFCQQQLSQWQMPRDFWIVDEIPSNERGKISRRALAESFARRGTEAEISKPLVMKDEG
jgi:acyl-CoA synthetase (AMP-forming)/AMP-acid ligase II